MRRTRRKDKKVLLCPCSGLIVISDDDDSSPNADALHGAEKTEMRRKKRVAQRQAEIVCFACRQQGHSAADCSVIRGSIDGNAKNPTKNLIGICYRYVFQNASANVSAHEDISVSCGSSRHTLARCKKKTVDPANDLPFASCFVCSGKGHLASQCPQNKAKGIYPNGGCCKLCGDNTHLSRNCKLRKDGAVPCVMNCTRHRLTR